MLKTTKKANKACNLIVRLSVEDKEDLQRLSFNLSMSMTDLVVAVAHIRLSQNDADSLKFIANTRDHPVSNILTFEISVCDEPVAGPSKSRLVGRDPFAMDMVHHYLDSWRDKTGAELLNTPPTREAMLQQAQANTEAYCNEHSLPYALLDMPN